jgi:hypothetical protein
MGAGLKMVMGLRIISLIVTLAVVGLSAWCKNIRFNDMWISLTVRISYIHCTRNRRSGTGSVATTTARGVDSATMASFFHYRHQQHYQDMGFHCRSTYLQALYTYVSDLLRPPPPSSPHSSSSSPPLWHALICPIPSAFPLNPFPLAP